ncbi:hypothetical protein DFH06DRAFT_533720 [Mycena polygramma]|nr:hypothetical protein DFH06DRAFT_533720 [Mycena polygramma]
MLVPTVNKPALMVPYSLPWELIDMIIDVVAVQKVKRIRANLAACSLVCRAWLYRSRRHFFYRCRLLLHSQNIHGFAALIRSPLCTIRSYVHQLSLRNDGHTPRQFDGISDVLAQLTKVTSLRLIGPVWAAHGAPPRRGFMKSLPNVVDLEVDCADGGDVDHALQIFCAFPALATLSVKAFATKAERLWRLDPPVPYTHADYLLPELVTPPTHLSTLSIEAPAVFHILHWLDWVGHVRLTTLNLRLATCTEADVTCLRRFLQSQSATLEDCTIIHHFSRLDEAQVNHILDFSAFKRLQRVHIGPLFGVLAALGAIHTTLPSVIRTLHSGVFTCLTLEFHATRFDTHLALPEAWASIDTFLANNVVSAVAAKRPPFSLRIFTSPLPTPTNKDTQTMVSTLEKYERAVEVLTTGFPRLHALGALDLRLDALKMMMM